MKERGASAPSVVPAEQVWGRTELEEKRNKIREDFLANADREKKRLALKLELAQIGEQLQPIKVTVARSDRHVVRPRGSSLAVVLQQEESRQNFGAVLGSRTSITRAKREATRGLGLLSKRP